MPKRITAREFQKAFQKQTEPVLVGDGIWFPAATDELQALADGVGTPKARTPVPPTVPKAVPRTRVDAVGPSVASGQGKVTTATDLPFSKQKQSAGKMPR